MYASNSVQRKGLFLAVALTIYTFGHLHYRELDKGFEENRFPDYFMSRKKAGVASWFPCLLARTEEIEDREFLLTVAG